MLGLNATDYYISDRAYELTWN